MDQVERLMDYPAKPTGARRLDDELLAVFTERYVDTAPEKSRRQLLWLRLGRVRGKFSICSLHDGHTEGRPVSAARAVRDLAHLVATTHGIRAAVVVKTE